MTGADVLALLPLLVLAGTAVVVMMAIAVRRHHGVTATLTVAGLAAALLAVRPAGAVLPREVTPLLVIDSLTLVYAGLLIGASIVVAALAYGYFRHLDEPPEELYLLLVIATLGAVVMVASRHFASLFLGLETLSVSLYGLVAYRRSSPRSIEAGLKYLLLAGASSAFLLLGMALLYAATGTMELPAVAARLASAETPMAWVLGGLALVLAGVGFKLAAVPFHLWTPDVYEGAPAPVTAFIASVSKGAMLGALLRFAMALDMLKNPGVFKAIAIMAVASMLTGTFLALLQNNVKRILAYSSIAQMGYLLLALLAGGAAAVEAATFYLITYFVTILAAFGVVSALAGPAGEREDLADYRGLFWARPVLAGVLAAALFSLAGMPLTAGFVGKYVLVAAGVEAALWLPVFTLVLSSAVGIFYYLRIVVAMYSTDEEAAARPAAPALSLASGLALAGLALLLFWLGLLPSGLLALLGPTAASLM